MKKTYLIAILCITTFIIACKKNSTTNTSTTIDCANVTAKFSTDASPIIVTKCATNSNCHASGATNSGGVLTNYAQISNKKSNIKTSVTNGSMPQGGTLTQSEKQAIVCWIDNGALNN
jgi:uncharacterized membrane protein